MPTNVNGTQTGLKDKTVADFQAKASAASINATVYALFDDAVMIDKFLCQYWYGMAELMNSYTSITQNGTTGDITCTKTVTNESATAVLHTIIITANTTGVPVITTRKSKIGAAAENTITCYEPVPK